MENTQIIAYLWNLFVIFLYIKKFLEDNLKQCLNLKHKPFLSVSIMEIFGVTRWKMSIGSKPSYNSSIIIKRNQKSLNKVNYSSKYILE